MLFVYTKGTDVFVLLTAQDIVPCVIRSTRSIACLSRSSRALAGLGWARLRRCSFTFQTCRNPINSAEGNSMYKKCLTNNIQESCRPCKNRDGNPSATYEMLHLQGGVSFFPFQSDGLVPQGHRNFLLLCTYALVHLYLFCFADIQNKNGGWSISASAN